MSKIRFRCSGCSKTLAVSAAHAGKVVACPECGANLRIPAAPAEPAAAKPSAPPPNPFREDDNEYDELEEYDSYGDSDPQSGAHDDMGFGHVPEDESGGDYGGVAGSEPAKVVRRVRPGAAGKPAEQPRDTTGKSVVGAIVAMMVAAFFCVVWLVVITVTGYELGILAWGMGGAVGLVAGVIARNPSPVYCGFVSVIAIMGVLAAKGIMMAFISLVTVGAGWLAEMEMAVSPAQQKLNHAMADQMLEDGQFEGAEKAYAEKYVTSYFSGSSDVVDEMTEEEQVIAEQVQQRLRDAVMAKSEAEREALLAAARDRHPEWIEDENHYLAMLGLLANEEGTLTEELAAQANSELMMLDDEWDEEYGSEVDYTEQTRRSAELRKLAAERLVGMSDDDKDQAVRDVLQQHPSWRPYQYAYSAMVEKLHREGDLTGTLAEHAEATVAFDMTPEYPDYYEEVPWEEQNARDKQLQELVNERLVTMDTAEREALIADAKTRYPDWYTADGLFMGMDEDMQEALDELGTDGTLWGNFTAVFSLFDVLWMFLCATTAYGTAHKCGLAEA